MNKKINSIRGKVDRRLRATKQKKIFSCVDDVNCFETTTIEKKQKKIEQVNIFIKNLKTRQKTISDVIKKWKIKKLSSTDWELNNEEFDIFLLGRDLSSFKPNFVDMKKNSSEYQILNLIKANITIDRFEYFIDTMRKREFNLENIFQDLKKWSDFTNGKLINSGNRVYSSGSKALLFFSKIYNKFIGNDASGKPKSGLISAKEWDELKNFKDVEQKKQKIETEKTKILMLCLV